MGLFSRDPDDDDDTDGGGSPFEGRGFILSAIIVGAVVVCGIALFVLTRGGDEPQATPTTGPSSISAPTTAPTSGPTDGPTGPATPDPTSTARSTPRPGQSDVLACRLPQNTEGLDAAPAGVSWDFANGVLVPVRENLGPSMTDEDGLQHCYRRSPAGAVVAILNTLAQAQDDRYLISVVERRVADGPGKSLALDEAHRHITSPTPDEDDDRYTSGQLQYVGYRVIDYTSTKAIISVAVQPIPDRVGEITMTVRWVDGDWKLVLRADGQIGPDATALASLNGYVRFRGS